MPDDESVLSRAARPPDDVVLWGRRVDAVADVRHGSPARPLLVLVHGGFWRPAYDRVHVRATTEALADAGWTVAAPEYRRVPGDPDATVEDVATALAELPRLLEGHHDGRVVVLGHSAGGHLALWAASAAPAPGLAGTVALGAVADLALADRDGLGDGAVRAFLGVPATERTDLDPARMPAPASRVVLVHGEDDDIVPVNQAGAYLVAHPYARALRVPDAGHFAVIDPQTSAWQAVLAAIAALTGAP